MHRAKKLERADGELVETHRSVLVDARDRDDMLVVNVLRMLKILKYCAGSSIRLWLFVDAETLQRLDIEMAQQFLVAGLLRKIPVGSLVGVLFVSVKFLEQMSLSLLKDYLLRLELHEKFVDIVAVALATEELAR